MEGDKAVQTIFEQSPISTQIFSPDGTSIMANKAWEKLWGVKHELIAGKYNVLKDKQLVKKRSMKFIKQGFAGKVTQVPAIKYAPSETVDIQGVVSYRWVSALIYPVKDAQGKIINVVLQHTDITMQKDQEEKLKEAYALNKNILESITDVFVAYDRKWNFTYINKQAEKVLHLKAKELIGKNAWEEFPKHKGSLLYKKLHESAKTKKPVQFEFHGLRSQRWYSVRAYPSTEGIAVYYTDITDKKEKEEEQEFQLTILENISDAVIVTKPDWTITQFNKASEKLYGLKAKEAIGKKTTEIFDDIFADTTREEAISELYKTNVWKGKLDQKVLKTGKVLHIFGSVSLIKDKEGNPLGVIAINNDISKTQKAEEMLAQSEERLRIALDAGKIGVWDWDIIKNKITWSDRVYEIHGIKRSEFKGNIEQYTTYLYPEDRKLVADALEKALKDKEPYSLEFRAYGPHKKIIWLLTSGRVIFDEDGEPVRMLGATVDITERKTLEKQKDEFIGVASHELKTPVTSLKAYGQILQTIFKKKDDAKSVALLQKMDMQIDKLSILISDLLDVTRIEEGRLKLKKERFNFTNMIKDVIEDVKRLSDKHIIVFNATEDLYAHGDRDRYGQVVTNLLTNAIKYSPDGGEILVTCEEEEDNLLISVEDSGVGIPKNKQEKVFERFFRVDGKSKDTFPGLGLGLYVSSEIVKRQGGKIWVESTVGRGSTFYFTVPL